MTVSKASTQRNTSQLLIALSAWAAVSLIQEIILVKVNKLADRSQGRLEEFFFNSYYTEV